MKCFRILSTSLGVLLISVLPLYAQIVSPEEAMAKAQQFLNESASTDASVRRAPRKKPQLNLADRRGDALYIFNDEANGGYVVVSGDERMPDILGYSYEGGFDATNVPCNMAAVLEGYTEQVKYVREHNISKAKAKTTWNGHYIEPLCSTKWNQGKPYNNKCPVIDGGRCVTGCVATAMAQIMAYHQWPQKTTKTIPAYQTRTEKIDIDAIRPTTIHWSDMIDSYADYHTEKQADAVATLMKLCGAAVQMDYRRDGSGAALSPSPFIKYFGYDEMSDNKFNCQNLGNDEWEQMIYDELEEQRPVLCDGENDEGAHAFVVDGHAERVIGHYFHFNWGWGGAGGFFLLSRSLYPFGNDVIVGLKPLRPGDPKGYGVLENDQLTLYYDNQPEARSGTLIPLLREIRERKDITKCVIDPSFKACKRYSLANLFEGCENLKEIVGLENLNTEYVRDMSGMFSGCSSLTDIDLSHFNTENVTNMWGMFDGCSSLTSIDLSPLNTDNVTDMSEMFYRCYGLTSLDLSHFNTENVTNMGGMFSGCSSLTDIDLSPLNTENVTYMGGMFSGCSSLTDIDLSPLNTDNVTNMSSMFFGCSSLTDIDLSPLNTENVTYMGSMFSGCSSLTDIDLSHFNTENVTDMSRMFYFCSSLTSLDLSHFNTDNVTDMSRMFSYCYQLKRIYVGNEWSTANVTIGNDMFDLCPNLVGGAGTRYDENYIDFTYAHIDGGMINPGYFRDKNLPEPPEAYAVLDADNTVLTFYYDNQMESRDGMDVYKAEYPRWNGHSGDITTVVFDESFASCMTLTSTANWFFGCSSLTSIDLSHFNTEKVTDMSYMFYGCSSLTNLDLSHFNTENVTNMSGMFRDCSSLTNLNLSHFNTDNVRKMSDMFYNCPSLTSLDLSHFNTEKVTGMSGMFSGCSGLTSLDLSPFNTEKVTDISYMFRSCSSLTNLDLSHFNTENVTDMGGMFYLCSSLTSIDLSHFNTETVTYMYYIFCGCSSLTSIDLSHFNTENVTYMSGMFSGCSSLTSIDLSPLNTEKVTNMRDMFSDCSGLTSLDLSPLNTENVTDMGGMFLGCSGLTSLDLSPLNTDNVTDMRYMFYGCSGLTDLDLSQFNTGNVTDMSYMFCESSSLTTIYVGNGWSTEKVENGEKMFYCTRLVGGSGTQYNWDYTGLDYAHIDGGPENPGYLTYKPTDGIQAVRAEDDESDIFNLRGVKIRNGRQDTKGLPKGIYIQNGKKVVIK